MIIENNDEQSSRTKTAVTVKQGGPLSPLLFSIYTEELIDLIRNRSNHGTALNIGILMYTDDIMIVSNKKWKINVALKICEKYGDDNQIKWNPGKTQSIEFNKGVTKVISVREKRTKIEFCGAKIDFEKQMKYLGIKINEKIKTRLYVDKRREAAIKTVFTMTNIGFNRKELASEMRAYPYKTLARPVLTYGLEPLVMTANDKKIISTTEGNLIKGLLGLSRN